MAYVSRRQRRPGNPQPRKRSKQMRQGLEMKMAVDEKLLEHMKAWRRDTAKAAGLPVFFILNDAGLIDLCRKRPRNMHELMRVSGVGVKKAEAYGTAIKAASEKPNRMRRQLKAMCI